MIEIRRYSTAGAFLDRAERWLLAAEIEAGDAYASARQARADDSLYQQPVYWATVEDDGKILGCAYRTPPYHVGVSTLPSAAIEPLVANLREIYTAMSGFSGPEATATALAHAWTARHGGSFTVGNRARLLAAAAIAKRATPHGALRIAQRSDAGVVQAWGDAGAQESGIAPLHGTQCVRLLRAGQIYLWDDGRPRAMVGVIRQSAQGSAIGIVYTSIEWRRQGYASAAVAALARLSLTRAPRCYLYADPASTPINALADALGFTLVHEAADATIR